MTCGTKRTVLYACAAAVMIGASACGEDTPAVPAVDPKDPAAPVLLAAGDIASCDSNRDEATAQLVEEQRGTVATIGDNAYEYGTPDNFAQCYEPTWGRFKDRTRPTPGNHEYAEEGAPGYFGYFGAAAGPAGKGWYAYEVGNWQIVALNSVCEENEGGCGERSPQGRWLDAQLERSRSRCTLAYFHHPRFSSGAEHGDNPEVAPLWRILYRHGADVVLSAHDHSYERFAPLSPAGRRDPRRGIRQFVVGTGGKTLRPFGTVKPGSEVRNATTFGILKLSLGKRSYHWRFLPVADQTFTDSGSGQCR